MKFRHRVRNAQYTYEPADREHLPGGRIKRYPGILLKFSNHYFDTLDAQRKFKWTDAQRKDIEEYLQTHADFDRPWTGGWGGLFLGEHEQAQRLAEQRVQNGEAEETEEVTNPAVATAECIYTIELPDGAEKCSRPARTGSDFCNEHFRVLSLQKVADVQT